MSVYNNIEERELINNYFSQPFHDYSFFEDPNPPIRIETVKWNNLSFSVIRDDYLIGGTKQRALYEILLQHSATEFVYAGPIYGYAQIALAYAASLTGKQATVFLARRSPLHPFTQKAEELGANIIQIPHPAPLKRVQEEAQYYVEQVKDEMGDDYIELMPFGLHSEEFMSILKSKIEEALPPQYKNGNYPKRLWLAVGSGTILATLYRIWPNTHFMLVQVGKWIDESSVAHMNRTIFIAPEKFSQVSKHLPPYPSVSTYDAKLWQFVEQYGEDGDYIWNVGRDVVEDKQEVYHADDYTSYAASHWETVHTNDNNHVDSSYEYNWKHQNNDDGGYTWKMPGNNDRMIENKAVDYPLQPQWRMSFGAASSEYRNQ